MNTRVLWLGLALVGGLGSACKVTTPAAAPAGGAGGGVSTAGSGGTLAASGTGATAAGGGMTGSAGTGAAGASASVSCGTATCTAPPPNPGLSATPPGACCSDSAQNLCGSLLSGVCNPPLPAAPSCPMIAFSMTRPCCITATNTCGVDASAYGKGCLDVSASMAGKKFLCDGTEVQPGGAAGASGGAGGTKGAGGAAGSTSAAGNGGHGGAGAAGH